MANGLTNKEVIEQKKKYGSNEITKAKQKTQTIKSRNFDISFLFCLRFCDNIYL